MTDARNTIIRMTETTTGRVTYVTPKGNAAARGRAHRYPDDRAQAIADGFAETNPGYTFTTEQA